MYDLSLAALVYTCASPGCKIAIYKDSIPVLQLKLMMNEW